MGQPMRSVAAGICLRLFSLLLRDLLPLMEFGGQVLARLLAQSLFDESARVTTFRTGEALGFDLRLAAGRHNHFDDFFHAAPPLIWMVSLTEPSASGCSVTV